MTSTDWIRSHGFLAPLARVRGYIDEAVAQAAAEVPVPEDFDRYAEDFGDGIPLLQSSQPVDLEPAGESIIAALAILSTDAPDVALKRDAMTQTLQLQHDRISQAQVVDWLLGDEIWDPARAGLLRSVGWLTLSRSMRPLVQSFAKWRNEDRWLRRYCPTCGSLPAMAQLVGVDPGRQRFMSCGRCQTQWRYGRTSCPYCETQSHRLTSVGIDGERGLRIDYCESCRGYLKTYNGQGDESVLLADWTSLHLDLVARERGLKRMATSLYDIDEAIATAHP
jgi:FdhE protein